MVIEDDYAFCICIVQEKPDEQQQQHIIINITIISIIIFNIYSVDIYTLASFTRLYKWVTFVFFTKIKVLEQKILGFSICFSFINITNFFRYEKLKQFHATICHFLFVRNCYLFFVFFLYFIFFHLFLFMLYHHPYYCYMNILVDYQKKTGVCVAKGWLVYFSLCLSCLT